MKPKEKTVISLRGHHLRILRFYCGYRLQYRTIVKRVQTANPIEYYGRHHAEKVVEIIKKVRRPAENIFFKITCRIDDICRSCKKRRRWKCCRSGRIKTPDGVKFFHTASKEDREIAKRFGLKIGKIYPAKEMLKKLRG